MKSVCARVRGTVPRAGLPRPFKWGLAHAVWSVLFSVASGFADNLSLSVNILSLQPMFAVYFVRYARMFCVR